MHMYHVRVPKKTQKTIRMRKFCGCFSLEFGAFFIGVVRLIWASIDGFSKITGGFSLLFDDYQSKREAIWTIYLGFYIWMAYGLSSALLVSGVLKNQIESIQCYRYTARTTTCILFLISLAFIAHLRGMMSDLKFTYTEAILILLYTAVEVYCLYVVGSLYSQMKGNNQREKEQPLEIVVDPPIFLTENYV